MVAISGLNNTDNPAPGIGIAKSLDCDLIGFSYDINEPGIYQDFFKKIYLMPYPSLGFNELKDRLEYIKSKTNLNQIIPSLDAELPLYIKYKEEIENMGIKLVLPSKESFELRNKNKLQELSKKLNIKYPKTFEVNSFFEVEKLVRDKKINFPFMVKGNYYKAYKAYNIKSAQEYFTKIANEWGYPILIQEIIAGEEVNLVGVSKDTLKGAIAIKKLSTTELGKIWSAITIENNNLLNLAKEFVRVSNWVGPFELECIVDKEDIYIIEINPRFPAWVNFATILGVNLPRMVIDIANGIDIKENFSYSSNKMFVRVVEEIVTDFSNLTKLLSSKEL